MGRVDIVIHVVASALRQDQRRALHLAGGFHLR
jgi:hypothetical protein